MLIAGGVVPDASGDLHPLDVRIEGPAVTAVSRGLRRRRGEEVLDAGGCMVTPGLWDHHVHLRAWAAASDSTVVGPPLVADRLALVAALTGADVTLPAGAWVRATGYHEDVAGPLDRHALDQMVPRRPVRVQHRSGALWMINSAGLDRLAAAAGDGPPGLEVDDSGVPTGRLWREDRWLAARTAPDAQGWEDRLSDLAGVALRHGVTGMTDATPGRGDEDAWEMAQLVADGRIPQRLVVMAELGIDRSALPRDVPVRIGPVKHLLDDIDLPDLDDVVHWYDSAHRQGRTVAVHVVTDVQLALVLAATAATGTRPGDRIEHAAVVPDAAVAPLAASRLTVVTSPGMVAARGDSYLSNVPADRHHELWRVGTLAAAGIPVAVGTDAPHGPADLSVALVAATTRATASGRDLGPAERVSPLAALSWWWGAGLAPAIQRKVASGADADLVVVSDPFAVEATVVGGQVLFSR